MKEHAASAPAFVGPRLRKSGTAGTASCARFQTACKKLQPLSRTRCLQPERAALIHIPRAARCSKQPRRRTVDSWLAEKGSWAAAVLQTVLGHLATAYTGAVFIGMVAKVMVLCMPALRLACAPVPHSEQCIMLCRRVQLTSASRHCYRATRYLSCTWDGLAKPRRDVEWARVCIVGTFPTTPFT